MNDNLYKNDYRLIDIIGLFAFSNILTIILNFIVCAFLKGKCSSYIEVYILIQSLSLLFFSISYSNLFPSFSLAFNYFFSFVPSFYELKKALIYFFISIILVILILTFSYFILQFFKLENISNAVNDYSFLLSPYRFFVYFTSTCFFGPLSEELFFRKIFYSYLRRKMSFPSALIISALFFGLLHSSSLSRIIFAFTMGVILSYTYEKYNSLFINICIHAYINIFSLLIIVAFLCFESII